MSKPGAVRLYGMLARNHAIGEAILQPGFPLEPFDTLQQWQRSRISRSFEDLGNDPGYRPAVVFFLSEIYGSLDFRERDQDLEKVMPVMTRFLPDRVLYTLSEAFELQAISLEYDVEMAAYMARHEFDSLDMSRYCVVYRACSDERGRERQIQLIRKLGYDLDWLVRKPFVNSLVRLLRGPAHAAGFGRLQEFLETGLSAFRALPDPALFVETIYDREWASMKRMFAGQEKPFGF